MKTFLIRNLRALVFLATLSSAQDVIPLPFTPASGSPPADYPEKTYFSQIWKTEVVTNVTKPSLTVFKPSPELRNGTAVVICPGGGFMALSITSEGNDVAKYLTARGVTAFVLKYRLAHTGEDATQEFGAMLADRQKFQEMLNKVVPLAVADGLEAVTYVRQHASEWGVSPDRVGIIGFSAGGGVTSGVAFKYKDYRAKGRERQKVMRLSIDEFIRRFLIHVLPTGFHRIRHYGLLSSGVRARNIARIRELLAEPVQVDTGRSNDADERKAPAYSCSCCGGRMIVIETFERGAAPRGAPFQDIRIDTS